MHGRPRDCVFLSHPQARGTGDYVHRVTWPGTHLARHLPVTELQTSHPGFVARSLQADLLIVTMVADEALERVMDVRARRGLPTVYEISDDFAAFPAGLPLQAFDADPRTRGLIERMASRADLLQFSSHGLLERYGHLNPARVLFENQTAQVPPLPPVPAARLRRPVIGWGASSGHLDDARRLARWLGAWVERRAVQPEIRLMVPEPLAAVFEQQGLTVRRHPTGSFDDYLAFLAEIDVGLALIDGSAFAQCRSDGKYLEYASRGVVCVASAQGEYLHGIRHGETGWLFGDVEGLGHALDLLHDDPDARMAMRLAAWRDVSERRTHARAAPLRLARYRALFPAQGNAAPDGPAIDEGRALESLVDPSEADLHEATRLHAQGMLAPALQAYLRVVERHPGFHLPWARAALVAQALGAGADAHAFARTGAAALEAQLQADDRAA
jgi:hypothetical protein